MLNAGIVASEKLEKLSDKVDLEIQKMSRQFVYLFLQNIFKYFSFSILESPSGDFGR